MVAATLSASDAEVKASSAFLVFGTEVPLEDGELLHWGFTHSPGAASPSCLPHLRRRLHRVLRTRCEYNPVNVHATSSWPDERFLGEMERQTPVSFTSADHPCSVNNGARTTARVVAARPRRATSATKTCGHRWHRCCPHPMRSADFVFCEVRACRDVDELAEDGKALGNAASGPDGSRNP
ncbi:hypothetical protein MRX96_044979 [Rhipicephalus microplus]